MKTLIDYPNNIISVLAKDYTKIKEFDINNFEKILYNIYSTHKKSFKEHALDILFDYYKNNYSFEIISKKYNITIKEIQQNLASTFTILKDKNIVYKFLIPKRINVICKSEEKIDNINLIVEIVDEKFIKDNILIDELPSLNITKNFLKQNKIKTINELLRQNYSTLMNLPNITEQLFKDIIFSVRTWIEENNYNIKDWPK